MLKKYTKKPISTNSETAPFIVLIVVAVLAVTVLSAALMRSFVG